MSLMKRPERLSRMNMLTSKLDGVRSSGFQARRCLIEYTILA